MMITLPIKTKRRSANECNDAKLLKELYSIRQQLLEKIEEATLLFSPKAGDPAFTTGIAALRNLEEWIDRIKEQNFKNN